MKKLFLTLMISLTFILSINATTIDSTAVDNFPKTDEVLSVMVQKAMIVAKQTGDFIIEQSPLLLQEFYNWNITKYISLILFGILLLILGFNIYYFFGKRNSFEYEYYDSYHDKTKTRISIPYKNIFIKYDWSDAIQTWDIVLKIIFIITGSIIVFINLYYLIFILVAPKLYLINYFIN